MEKYLGMMLALDRQEDGRHFRQIISLQYSEDSRFIKNLIK